ncbi:endodeoxyribonuclease [Rhizobium sp. BK376]|uniref:endodeoxyribonuclease n=1 Tax=Rhizobium sp. BK376 TaxID=2512149 RepID=UPI0010EFA4EE|nr:endodeoxyribonuclease [Rhizobium sp. BK376]TCR92603.1 phage endonuclease I [Rhizobium sp. BK376]
MAFVRNLDKGAILKGYRSGLEDKVADELRAVGHSFEYEQLKVEYLKPARKAKYTPDFKLANGIIVETKGRFLTEDRQKHLLVKAQHPELDIRFVFSSSRTRISKQSKTTYGMWCETHGFQYADKSIPKAWLHEPPKGIQ